MAGHLREFDIRVPSYRPSVNRLEVQGRKRPITIVDFTGELTKRLRPSNPKNKDDSRDRATNTQKA